MAGLLTSTQISNATGQFYKHWQTFSQFNSITINKEPLVSITNLDQNVLAGYGPTSQESNQTYTSVNASYPAMVVYPNQNKDTLMQDLKIDLSNGECVIKVATDCKDYIEDGKTLNIEVNGEKYDIVSHLKCQNFLGLRFWYYKLGHIT